MRRGKDGAGLALSAELERRAEEYAVQWAQTGMGALLGLKLSSVDAVRIVASFTVDAPQLNISGTVDGGILMSVADWLGGLGAALNAPNKQATATVDSHTNFLRSVRSGKLHADCRALHVGHATSVWRTWIRDEQGRPIACTTQTQVIFHRDN